MRRVFKIVPKHSLETVLEAIYLVALKEQEKTIRKKFIGNRLRRCVPLVRIFHVS